MAGFFGFYNYNKPGPGVSKDAAKKIGIPLYFDILLRKFWKMILLNLLHVISSIASFVVLWYLLTSLVAWGLSVIGFDITSITSEESTAMTILAICAVLTVSGMLGTGASTAASSYVLRNYVNDSHSWVASDYWEHFKKNFLQGTIVFIIDVVVICLFLVSILFYAIELGGVLSVFICTVLCVCFVIYVMMHMYIYQIMAKFKMKLIDIYKSSLILVLIKLPWNTLCLIVSGLITYFIAYLIITRFISGMLLVALIYFSLNIFTHIFMTNNIVRKYILEPSLEMEKQKEKDALEE